MPPNQNQPIYISGPNNGQQSRKALGLVLILLSVGVLGFLMYLLFGPQPDALLPSTPKQGESLYQPARYVCSTGNGTAVCQDVSSGEATKYRLPRQLARASTIIASPDSTKYVVQTLPDPLRMNDAGKVLITDNKFTVIQEVPAGSGNVFSSVAWTGQDNTVIIGRRNTEAGKSKLSLYDTVSKKESTLGDESTNNLVAYPSADGKLVFTEERAADKPVLKSFELSSRNNKTIDTSSLQQHLKSYATVGYDNVANTFYISGSAKSSDNSALVIAEVVPGDEQLQLAVTKVVSDEYAYVPKHITSRGMLTTRQHHDAPEYGFLSAQGSFTPSKLKPVLSTMFAVNDLPGLTASSADTLGADDYFYSLVDAPESLTRVARQLVRDPACLANSPAAYNSVTLHAQGGDQAVVAFGSCSTSTTELRYYKRNGASYSLVTSSFGLPDCSLKASQSLNDTVAPSCATL